MEWSRETRRATVGIGAGDAMTIDVLDCSCGACLRIPESWTRFRCGGCFRLWIRLAGGWETS